MNTIQEITTRLTALRTDWQEAAGGENLLEVNGSIGYLLLDVCCLLELTPEETEMVLGPDLWEAVQ